MALLKEYPILLMLITRELAFGDTSFNNFFKFVN